MTRKPLGAASPCELALRRIARSNRDPVTNVQIAVQSSDNGFSAPKPDALRALVIGPEPPQLAGIAKEQRDRLRARAIWAVVQDELDRLGRPEGERRRTALTAALHLDPHNTLTSIMGRLDFAREQGHFGVRSPGQRHGDDALHKWWGTGVRLLAGEVAQRLSFLADHPEQWQEYLEPGTGGDAPPLRAPRENAQPFFVEFFLTTVFMRGRVVERRITERIVTARGPAIGYLARGFGVGDTLKRRYVPIRALWGCTARPHSDTEQETGTDLVFPKPLLEGQKAHFASEVEPGGLVKEERNWINVDVDHHGIARGSCSHDGLLPTGGLTIRVRFDDECLPEAAWWYAELSDSSHRYNRPAEGDKRLLPIVGGSVQKTFTEGPCHPGEDYGIGFWWPPDQ